MISKNAKLRRGRSQAESTVASFEIRDLTPGKLLDLGVVTRKRLPILISGRVQDQHGGPLPDVSVLVSSFRADGRVVFNDVGGLNAGTDATGRFEIRGEPSQELSYKVRTLSKWLGDSLPFAPGVQGFLLTLIPQGKIQGKVWTDDPRVDVELRVTCQLRGSEVLPLTIPRQGGGQFLAKQLAPGHYDIVVSIAGIEVRRFENIEVQVGKTSKPSELQGFFLHNRVTFGKVTVLGPDGIAIAYANVTVDGEAKRSLLALGGQRSKQSGVAEVAVKNGESFVVNVIPWEKHGPNHRTLLRQTFTNPTFPLEVRLKYAPTIDLRLSRALPSNAFGHWTLALSRLRTPDELSSMRERHNKMAAGLKKLGLPPRPLELATHVVGATIALANGQKTASVELHRAANWEVLVKTPYDLSRHQDHWAFVVIGKLNTNLEEGQAFDLKLSDAMIQEIEALVAR
ncbi:MAG: carboxypeptidase-like regulatory domain-containing protein [Planctomycetota bacterium]